MPTKLGTTVKKVEKVPNKENSELIKKFHEFMISNGSSERHQNNNLKAVISFGHHLGARISFHDINTSKEIISFLNTKIKGKEEDSDQRWITTWNDYMHRIKHFLRWLHNCCSEDVSVSMEYWKTAPFLLIKEKRSKRISQSGGKQRSETWELNPEKGIKIAFCEDPFGNIIEIYSHSYEQTILSI